MPARAGPLRITSVGALRTNLMTAQPPEPAGRTSPGTVRSDQASQSRKRLPMVAATVGLLLIAGLWLHVRGNPEAPAQDPGRPAASTPMVYPHALPNEQAVPAEQVDDDRPPAQSRSRPAPRPVVSNPADTPVGVHAFPPLGTVPRLSGIIVPDDFELPSGYVRHYQSSDDGQPLQPILMFHPTRPPLDADGRPFDIPPDRIVPPEMVPEGMPIERLDVPETPDPQEYRLRRLFGTD
jgi:hypothetical protein